MINQNESSSSDLEIGPTLNYHEKEIFLPAATKLGQGNIFTPVCDSVNGGGVPGLVRGGAWSGPGGYLADTPPDQTPPRPDTPWTRQTPDQTPPRPDNPRTRHPPDQTPPPDQTHPTPGTRHSPWEQQTPEYGLRAAGTHPTGMHSCIILNLK